jgi:hypothetical protein
MESVLINVFTCMALSRGCSVDDILETPELREEFLTETRRVLGHLPEQQLLHRLTSLRKARRLPRSRDVHAESTNAA